MRSFSSATLAALAKGELVLRALVELVLDEGTFGFWTDIGNVVIDGVTYIGTGALATISVLPSTTNLSIPNYNLTLSGLDANVLNTFNDYTWHQRPVSIYLAVLDPQSMAFVDDPELIASGTLDKIEIKGAADNTATLEVSCEDISRKLTWKNPSIRSNGEQLRRNATDVFFQYTATAGQQQLFWGEKQTKASGTIWSVNGVIQPRTG